jgi:hypothetical protein
MIPLTVNPTVVILTDGQGNPIKTATNVASDLAVVTTQDPAEFDELAKGRPFVNEVEPNFILEPAPIDALVNS